jgi:enoyl-CoA hydratase
MSEYAHIDTEVRGDVFRIALDRPDEMNAVNGQLHEELSYVFRDAQEADTRVVVVTGNGPAFSAGGDFEWMQETVENPEAWGEKIMTEAQRFLRDLVQIEQPVIARVNGDAVGFGATLALFCDIVIATEDTRFGDPHVNVGLVAGDGGAVIWPLLTSLNKSKELLMTGDLISASEAKDLGLVNEVVPAEELDDAVDEMVEKLATQPQVALRFTKQALNQWLEMAMNLTLRDSLAMEGISIQHPDHAEAVDALMSDRRPEFESARGPEE